MTSNLADSSIRRLGRSLTPYTTKRSVAMATELAIYNEAALRRMIDLQAQFYAMTTGLQTNELRRRRREVAEVQQRHGLSSTHCDYTRPLVNWHDGGSGPALLLLNGWTASGLVWPESWLRALEQRYRVIRMDNRGTGWSRSAPHPFTIADLADDARNVLRACGVERATVLGLSMGGMIAQELALRHREVVDRLVLVATQPPTPAQIPSNSELQLAMMTGPPPGADLRQFFIEMWGDTAADGFAARHPDVIAEVADQIVARVTPRAAVVTQARAIWSWYGPARIRRISAPTTVVHGDRDPLTPVGNGMRLTRLIPDADYVELAGVGHLVPQEAGDALLEVLQPAQLSSSRRGS
ncbi:alpha/beta fold hydrolase [Mycolicibacterium thermoresistibile]